MWKVTLCEAQLRRHQLRHQLRRQFNAKLQNEEIELFRLINNIGKHVRKVECSKFLDA